VRLLHDHVLRPSGWVSQKGLQEDRLEGDGFEAFHIEPSELDAGVSVGGPVGPGVAEHGGVFVGNGVGEGQFVVVGSVEVEEVFDHPEEIADLRFVARLLQKFAFEGGAGVLAEFDPPAGQDSRPVLIRLRQEHVPIVDAQASDPVLEAHVLVVEGDHDKGEFIREPDKRI
jgi:hypothetical protein